MGKHKPRGCEGTADIRTFFGIEIKEEAKPKKKRKLGPKPKTLEAPAQRVSDDVMVVHGLPYVVTHVTLPRIFGADREAMVQLQRNRVEAQTAKKEPERVVVPTFKTRNHRRDGNEIYDIAAKGL